MYIMSSFRPPLLPVEMVYPFLCATLTRIICVYSSGGLGSSLLHTCILFVQSSSASLSPPWTRPVLRFLTAVTVSNMVQADQVYNVFLILIFFSWSINLDRAAGCYIMPLAGAYISDYVLGKYRTILYISLVYCAGHLLLALWDGRMGLCAGVQIIHPFLSDVMMVFFNRSSLSDGQLRLLSIEGSAALAA